MARCVQVKARLEEAPVEEDFEFDFMEPGNTARAMAALSSIPRLKVDPSSECDVSFRGTK